MYHIILDPMNPDSQRTFQVMDPKIWLHVTLILLHVHPEHASYTPPHCYHNNQQPTTDPQLLTIDPLPHVT